MASRAQARRLPDGVGLLPSSLAEVGSRVEARIGTLLDDEIVRWRAVDPDLAEPLVALRELVRAGGKRLRPAFCHWAYVGAGGAHDNPVVVDAGAALELLHTFALVHDDVMDGSNLRRGHPAVHRRFMTRHDLQRWRGDARRYGEGAAILVGAGHYGRSGLLQGDLTCQVRARNDSDPSRLRARYLADHLTHPLHGAQLDALHQTDQNGIRRQQ